MTGHVGSSGDVNAGGHGHSSLGRRRRSHGRSVSGQMVAFGSSLSRYLALGGECSGCGSCRLLDRSAVVILMSRERGSTSECLLAVGIGALVGSFPRVRPTMAGQRTAIAEGLCTNLAVVRFLTSVHPLVHGEGRPLDKLLAAVGVIAHMGTMTAVNSLMTGKIASPGELLGAGAAGI